MYHAQTRLFGVIGHPVGHSLGPVMHNAAFKAMGYPAVYVAFDVSDLAGAMIGMRALGIGGLSVTLPHKVAVMDHLEAIDPLAARIGAVNTVVHHDDRLTGFNTDCYGAMAALKGQIDLAGKCAAILGAGGAARALGFGLKAEGARVVIYNRSEHRGRELADALQAEFRPWSKRSALDADVVINTTSIGMSPQGEVSPLPEQALASHMVVMDIVYAPLETRLLHSARSRGCRIIDGLSMFVLQGARQLELWTGQPAPLETMRQAVLVELSKK